MFDVKNNNFFSKFSQRSSSGGAAVGAALPENVSDKDLYALLGISIGADALEIRAAYRRAALASHPDKGGCSEAFQNIAAAFNVLSCPATRSVYDRDVFGNLQKRREANRKGRKRPLATGSQAVSADAKSFVSPRLDQALRSELEGGRRPLP